MAKKAIKEGVKQYYDYQLSDNMVMSALRAARINAGLTQIQLADRLNVTSQFICNIENGRGRNWLRYMPKIQAWLNACGCSLHLEARVIVDPSEKKGRKLPDRQKITKKV